MKLQYLSAVAIAVVLATPAQAQEVPPIEVTVSGLRIEARAGWDRVSAEVSDDTASITAGQSGVTYGAEIGYDFQTPGRTLIGVYAGIEGSTVKACEEVFGLDELCVKANRNITVGGRLGLVTAPGSVMYAKAGYSNAGVGATYRDFEGILDNLDESTTLDGWHVGAGGEFAVGASTYGKVEYVYTSYGNYREPELGSLGLDRHQIVVGFGYRF